MSDLKIALMIISIFVIIGTILPFIQDSLGDTSSTPDVDNLVSDIGDKTGSSSSITTALNVITSILGMFFWTFGSLPAYLDVIFIVPRLILVLLAIRIFRGVG